MFGGFGDSSMPQNRARFGGLPEERVSQCTVRLERVCTTRICGR